MPFLKHWRRLRILLGAEICEHCGSPRVTQYGFEGYNHRHVCGDCGKETVVMRV